MGVRPRLCFFRASGWDVTAGSRVVTGGQRGEEDEWGGVQAWVQLEGGAGFGYGSGPSFVT